MRYSLVNGERSEAQPGLSGQCQLCDRPTIARCGKVKIWHWAHKGKLICDPWKENETEWHRAWKRHFPEECQEIIQYAENGEKHIADVRIEHGYVIEFQHSHISPEERQSREDFHKKIVWVVDGTRRKTDKDKFFDVLVPVDGKESVQRFYRSFNKCALIRDWVGSSSVPVFFDFNEEMLWGILPRTVEEKVYVFGVKRNALIEYLYPAQQTNSFDGLLNSWVGFIENFEKSERLQAWLKLPPFLRSFQPRPE